MKESKDCMVCRCTFNGRKQLIRHIETCHDKLSVKCSFCCKIFKRARDFERHCMKSHNSINFPSGCFKEKYLSSLAVNCTDFVAIYRQDQTSPSWVWWKHQSTGTNVPEVDTILVNHISVMPGSVQAEGEVNFSKFIVSISDKIFSDSKSMRSFTRRMAALPLNHRHDPSLELLPLSSDDSLISPIAAKLGVEKTLITHLFHSPVLFSGDTTPLRDESDFHVVPDLDLANTLADSLQDFIHSVPNPSVPSIVLPPPSTSVYSTTSLLPATPVQSIVFPTPSPQPLSVAFPPPSNHSPIVSSAVLSIPTKTILSAALPHSPLSATVPVVTTTQSDPESGHISFNIPDAPKEEYRANKLLRMGAMPLFPPARRSWDKEEVISIPLGSQSVAWPPKNWKSLSPDQRLLQVEFLSMSILKSRGQDFSTIERCDLLNQFNFLVLPGTLPPQCPKHDVKLRSCAAAYHQLRLIATGKIKDGHWLAMIETSAMLRDTKNDKLIKQCDPVPLRL